MHIIHKFKNPVLLEILFIILLCIFMSVHVYAKENSEPTFLFEMSIEGNDTKEVSCGDIITVDLKLNRTDMDHPYTMKFVMIVNSLNWWRMDLLFLIK